MAADSGGPTPPRRGVPFAVPAGSGWPVVAGGAGFAVRARPHGWRRGHRGQTDAGSAPAQMRPAPRPPVPPGGKAGPATTRVGRALHEACAGRSASAPPVARRRTPPAGWPPAVPHEARCSRRLRPGPSGAPWLARARREAHDAVGEPGTRRRSSGGVPGRHVEQRREESARRSKAACAAAGLRPAGGRQSPARASLAAAPPHRAPGTGAALARYDPAPFTRSTPPPGGPAPRRGTSQRPAADSLLERRRSAAPGGIRPAGTRAIRGAAA